MTTHARRPSPPAPLAGVVTVVALPLAARPGQGTFPGRDGPDGDGDEQRRSTVRGTYRWERWTHRLYHQRGGA